jgi:PAS domain S-box-containing protein
VPDANTSHRLARLAQILVDASPDALLAITPAGQILFWNQGCETIFGYSAAEAVGGSIFDLTIPADRVEETQKAIAATLETGSTAYESTRRTKHGSPILVDVAKRLVRDPSGDFLVAGEKDVTALRSLHEAARMQARFRGLLEEASRLKSEFLANMSRDTGKFKQILYNYLSNALKFTPDTGRIAIRAAAEGRDAFRLEVEGTGIGIELESMDQLFKEFQQLDASAEKNNGSVFFAVLPRVTRKTRTPRARKDHHDG